MSSVELQLKNINEILERLISLRKENLSLYYKLKKDNFTNKELLKNYFAQKDEIKNINQFLLTDGCLKEYHIKEYLKGSKYYPRIEGSYNFVSNKKTFSGGDKDKDKYKYKDKLSFF